MLVELLDQLGTGARVIFAEGKVNHSSAAAFRTGLDETGLILFPPFKLHIPSHLRTEVVAVSDWGTHRDIRK